MAKKQSLTEALYLDNWPRRRRWMITLLVWLMGNAQYLILFGQDTALHQNALVALLSAIVAIIGSYIFGATWDDREKRRNLPPMDEGE